MITNKDIKLFIGYNDFGYNGRFVPAKYKNFSNSKEFKQLLWLFDRLLLEKNTKVSQVFSEETSGVIKSELDSQETIDYFKNYVLNYDPNKQPEKSNPWWKLW